MMETNWVQRIVQHLNKPPFELGVRLVDFDQKAPPQLLETLVAVLQSIDSSNSYDGGRSYYNNHKLIENKIIPCLSAMEYPLLPRESEAMNKFVKSISEGNRDDIHRILLFCLDNQNDCCEKIYLASFLTRIESPLGTQYSEHDEAILELVERYHQMQIEFKESYVSYIEAKKRDEHIRETVDDAHVESIKNEKIQLLERVQELEESLIPHKEDESFLHMWRVTKLLKREKEEEISLEERLKEQNNILHLWEQNLKDVKASHTLNRAWSNEKEGLCMQAILQKVEDEITDIKVLVKSDLVPIICELEEKIHKQESFSCRPQHTHQDLEYKLQQKRKLDDEIDEKVKMLHVEQAKATYARIDLYYQHTMVAKQNLGAKEKILEQKKKDLTAKRRAISKLQHFIDTIRRPVQSEIELPDGTMLNIDNAHTYLKECQDIINEKEEREALLASLKEENIKLGETLNSIKDRFGSNIDEILEARHKIQAIDEESNEVNMAKGQTLQQISEIVTEMTETLKTERENLEPMIKKLKAKRGQYTEMKHLYDGKRARYESLKMKLAKDRRDLENDHDQHQKQWKQREREYHFFFSLNEILKVNLKRTEVEEKWRSGHAETRSEFDCVRDLYEFTLTQDGNQEKILRLEQKQIKDIETESLKQKRMFTQLQRLLGLKHRLSKEMVASKSDQSIETNSITSYI